MKMQSLEKLFYFGASVACQTGRRLGMAKMSAVSQRKNTNSSKIILVYSCVPFIKQSFTY